MGTGNLSWQCNIQYIPISCYIYSPVIKHGNGQFPIYFIYGYILPTMPHLIAGPALVALVPQVLKQSSHQFGDGSSICTRCLELSWNTGGNGRSSCWRDEWHTCMGLLYFDLQNLRMMITVGHVLSMEDVLTTCSYIFSLRHLETSWDTHPNTKGSILWGRHQWEVDKNWRGFQVCRRARSTWNSASVTSSRGDQQQRLVEKQSLVSLFGDEKSPKKWKRHVNTKHHNQHFEGPFSPLVLHFWTLATLIFEKMGYGMVVGYQLMDRWFRLKRPKIAVAHNKAFLCWDTWFWYIFWLQENANLVVGFLSSLGFESSNIHINNKPTRFGNLSGTLASKFTTWQNGRTQRPAMLATGWI